MPGMSLPTFFPYCILTDSRKFENLLVVHGQKLNRYENTQQWSTLSEAIATVTLRDLQ